MHVYRIAACATLALVTASGTARSQTIHDAAGQGDVAAVSRFLEQDPHLVNSTDDSDCTPLHYAAGSGFLELSELLVEHGADVNAQSYEHETPLHWAAVRSHGAVVELLLAQGPDTEIGDDYGRTPLLLVARETGNVDVATALLDGGADVDARDRFDSTPLELAAWRGFGGVVDLFLDRGATVPTGGQEAEALGLFSIEKGLVRLFRILADDDADLSARNENGGSLLHSASKGGSPEIVEVMLDRGLEIDEQDRYGRTPLHYAAEMGRLQVVELLVDRGAKLDLRSLAGYSAFNVALAQGREEVSELLQARGASTDPVAFPDLEGPYLGQQPPGADPTMFAPDIVASHRFEHGTVTFSPDGSEAYWATSNETESGYTYGMIVMSRLEDGRWTPPEPAPFSRPRQGDDVPFFAPDGSKLFFLSTRPDRDGNSGGERIWVLDRTDHGWSEPRMIEGGPNELGKHWQFSVAASGAVYFSSGDPGGYGMGDIYVSRPSRGAYATPENLGAVVNTEYGEGAPFIAPDESYLLFMRVGAPDATGRVDLYVSFKDESGRWTAPVNMGARVNTRSNEICPIVSSDGKYLFFNSFRSGNADNYWMDAAIIEELRAR